MKETSQPPVGGIDGSQQRPDPDRVAGAKGLSGHPGRWPEAFSAWKQVMARIGGLVAAMIIAAIAFQLMTGAFFTTGNILSIFEFMTTMAVVGFGETLVVVAGEIDLSLGAIYGLAAMTCGLLWTHGMPFLLSMVIGLLVGSIGGLVNGLIVTGLGVNSFIITLGMLNLVEGITYYISNNTAISPGGSGNGFNIYLAIGAGEVAGIPSQIFWLIAVGIVMWVVLHRTVLGFWVAAVGGNVRAARAAHLPVKRIKTYTFIIAGALAALAGIIDFSLVGSTAPTAGSTLIFPVFAAVVIGGASLSGGRGSIIGTLLGALLLEILTNGLGLLGAGAFAQLLFVGGVIIAAVAVDRWSAQYRARGEVQF